MSRADTGKETRETDPPTVRLKFDLRDEQTSCTPLAINLREPGNENEQVIFLELAGDRSSAQVIERNPMQGLALSVAQAGSGMPLTLLATPHLARAAQVRCGAQTWTPGPDRLPRPTRTLPAACSAR